MRRRRRDQALLKTLGLVRRQALSVAQWQALSQAPAASIPLPLVLLTIPVTAVLAAGLAVGPGRAAARLRAGVVLRAE